MRQGGQLNDDAVLSMGGTGARQRHACREGHGTLATDMDMTSSLAILSALIALHIWGERPSTAFNPHLHPMPAQQSR